MPCNSYGINDNYDLQTSHFFPALLRKIIEATRYKRNFIKIWGSGKALREIIYCDDIADACIFFLNKKTKHSVINIGTGVEKTIKSYAEFIMSYLKVKLKIVHEDIKFDGTYRKILDTTLAAKYGWRHKISLEEGLSRTINDYLRNYVLNNKTN